MTVFVLIMFIAGHSIESPGHYTDKEACIATGERIIEDYRQFHSHSRAWFWCLEGRET